MGLLGTLRKKDPQYPASLKIALTGILAALTMGLTAILQFPVPATGGYINIGEIGVFISALLMGPVGGAVAGGIGSALADVYLGYVFFAPWTLLIKGLEGLIIGLFSSRSRALNAVVVVVAGLWMVTGYFLLEGFLFGVPAAMSEIPGNLVQVGVGASVAVPVAVLVRPVLPFPREESPVKTEPTTKSQ